MKKLLIAAALLAASAMPAKATFTVYGVGLSSCGQWLKDLSDNEDRYIDMAWVEGFLSSAGYNGVHLTETDSSAIQVWITNYCQANPLKKLKDAVEELEDALEKK